MKKANWYKIKYLYAGSWALHLEEQSNGERTLLKA